MSSTAFTVNSRAGLKCGPKLSRRLLLQRIVPVRWTSVSPATETAQLSEQAIVPGICPAGGTTLWPPVGRS
jgi:hypothetical protein